jgi:hypothetical protein
LAAGTAFKTVVEVSPNSSDFLEYTVMISSFSTNLGEISFIKFVSIVRPLGETNINGMLPIWWILGDVISFKRVYVFWVALSRSSVATSEDYDILL